MIRDHIYMPRATPSRQIVYLHPLRTLGVRALKGPPSFLRGHFCAANDDRNCRTLPESRSFVIKRLELRALANTDDLCLPDGPAFRPETLAEYRHLSPLPPFNYGKAMAKPNIPARGIGL